MKCLSVGRKNRGLPDRYRKHAPGSKRPSAADIHPFAELVIHDEAQIVPPVILVRKPLTVADAPVRKSPVSLRKGV